MIGAMIGHPASRAGAIGGARPYLGGMMVWRILGMALLWLVMAVPAAAEGLSLGQISAYLNSFRTAEGTFTQHNDDGTTSTGKLMLKRPGRVRFDYDPPSDALVVADGDTVAVVDPLSNAGPQGYPLNMTPLKLILARHIDLGAEDMVAGRASDGETTTVRAQDPAHPDYGSIDLQFSNAPVRLTQWAVNDASGGRTVVVLDRLKTGVRLDDDLFRLPGDDGPRHDR